MLDLSPFLDRKEVFTCNVEANKIKELVGAVGNDNPIFSDYKTALDNGYKDTPAPLTYGVVLLFWGYPKIWDFVDEIGLDLSRMIHTKERYEYHTLIYPGDTLRGEVQITDSYSNELADSVTVTCRYTRNGEPAVTLSLTLMSVQE